MTGEKRSLTEEQIERFERQIVLPGVGGVGQRRLLDAVVAIACSPRSRRAAGVAALYLARAGVGTLFVSPDISGSDPLLDDLAASAPNTLVRSETAGLADISLEILLDEPPRHPAKRRVSVRVEEGELVISEPLPGELLPSSGSLDRESETAVGALAATAVLRRLLELDPSEARFRWPLD